MNAPTSYEMAHAMSGATSAAARACFAEAVEMILAFPEEDQRLAGARIVADLARVEQDAVDEVNRKMSANSYAIDEVAVLVSLRDTSVQRADAYRRAALAVVGIDARSIAPVDYRHLMEVIAAA